MFAPRKGFYSPPSAYLAAQSYSYTDRGSQFKGSIRYFQRLSRPFCSDISVPSRVHSSSTAHLRSVLRPPAASRPLSLTALPSAGSPALAPRGSAGPLCYRKQASNSRAPLLHATEQIASRNYCAGMDREVLHACLHGGWFLTTACPCNKQRSHHKQYLVRDLGAGISPNQGSGWGSEQEDYSLLLLGIYLFILIKELVAER